MAKLPIYFAPLQGYTDSAYRRTHHALCGEGVAEYYTPFVRLEHGAVRQKDLRDIMAENNLGLPVVPQLIASGADEMETLLAVIEEQGYKRVDVNMGCPFPMQTRRGRGAGLLQHPDRVREICQTMQRHSGVQFSLKMRLGMEQPSEWRDVIGVVNEMPLLYLTVHARVARQQYRGEVNMAEFEQLAQATHHRLVYNGDLRTADDIENIAEHFDGRLAGVMLGRGLLARPWLAMEYASGRKLTVAEKRDLLMEMHSRLMADYEHRLAGETQLLGKLRTMWDYMEPTLGRKMWKRLMKAGNLRNYLAAVSELHGLSEIQ